MAATNEPPTMKDISVAYATAEGAFEVKDVKAAYHRNSEPVRDMIEFKDADHKIVFIVPKHRLVYIKIDRAGTSA